MRAMLQVRFVFGRAVADVRPVCCLCFVPGFFLVASVPLPSFGLDPKGALACFASISPPDEVRVVGSYYLIGH